MRPLRLHEFSRSLRSWLSSPLRNRELIPDNLFLNTGVTKTMLSRYPGSNGNPYFIVVANSLDAVLKGSESLQQTDYYKDWPKTHFEIVVERRERMAKRYGKKQES